jgi:hypothetical protein
MPVGLQSAFHVKREFFAFIEKQLVIVVDQVSSIS